jgi:hypothetical protein
MLEGVCMCGIAYDALFRLCSLKLRERLFNFVAGRVLGTPVVCSYDGVDSAAGESADRNPDAHDLTGSVGLSVPCDMAALIVICRRRREPRPSRNSCASGSRT